MPQKPPKPETSELSQLLQRLLDDVDRANKQQSSVDVGCSLVCISKLNAIKDPTNGVIKSTSVTDRVWVINMANDACAL